MTLVWVKLTYNIRLATTAEPAEPAEPGVVAHVASTLEAEQSDL